MNIKSNHILIILCSLWATIASATHNRAGEITYRQVADLTIEMTVTTYTKTSSSTADRDTLEIFWGDGTSGLVSRTEELFLPNDVKVNKYVQTHTYPGRSTYTIFFEDPNRVANILNVSPPNSVEVPFFLSTTFTFLDSQFQGTNSSTVLLQPPLDIACVGQRFIHNPNAYDVDGDSLSYSLVTPLMSEDIPIDPYFLPNEISPGANNIISMNSVTGEFIWESPQIQGEYNIAIRIDEYRDGLLLNSIIRDMQILVRACNSTPPIIEVVDEICVVAGDSIDLEVRIDDLDINARVSLFASGGPFVQDTSSAQLLIPSGFLQVPFTARFTWNTTCEHISDQYYQVVFRAADNSFGDSTGLATLKVLRIKVVGPQPENLDGKSENSNIRLQWDQPYVCQDAKNEYFKGFSVWKREGSNTFPTDTCEAGMEGRGYQKIVFNTNNNDGNKYNYIDSNVEKGKTYCYRVLGEFARTSNTGFPFNNVGSLPSYEICVQVSRDLPLITKASVDSTNSITGYVHVRWTKPISEDLDTIANFGPYRYDIQRSILGDNNFTTVNTQTIPYFTSEIDTNYFDLNLNTVANQYTYRVQLKTGNALSGYGVSAEASTIFCSATQGDQKVDLFWSAIDPWDNYQYDLYRIDDNNDTLLLSTFTGEDGYRDLMVENNRQYCYYIDALGSYGLNDIEDPLENRSQDICVTAIDNEPPCDQILNVSNVCDQSGGTTSLEDFINLLRWTNPLDQCEFPEDLMGYNIYYSPNLSDELELLLTVDNSELEIEHMPANGILGCYSVTALDSLGNESMFSNIVCVDNCPLYELPNVFTPNGDDANDILIPRINRFINRVEFKLFNEWGNLIFETEDPNINWDGNHEGGNEVPAGTYLYSCRVIENRVDGEQEQSKLLRGYINIIRG